MIDFFFNLLNPQWLIDIGGLLAILIAIFMETGLLVGIFLPGDSLLFTAGLLTSLGLLDPSYGITRLQSIHPMLLLMWSLTIAGIAWDQTGYLIGRHMGRKLYHKPKSWLRNSQYLHTAEQFYRRHGWFAIIVGRFFPIIRTVVPTLAGVVGIDYRLFTIYNMIGCVLWVRSFVLMWYFLGRQFPQIQNYLQYIVGAMVIFSLIPIVYQQFKNRHTSDKVKKNIGMKSPPRS